MLEPYSSWPKRLAKQLARAAWGWVLRLIEQVIQVPLVALILAGILGVGSGAGATQVHSDPLRWALVAVVLMSLSAVAALGVVVVWRSESHRQIEELKSERDETNASNEALEKVHKTLVERLAVSEHEQQRTKAYRTNEMQVLTGLDPVLGNFARTAVSVDQVIEDTLLRPTSEVIAVMLGEGRPIPRVELGIAEAIPGGLRVTHASGPYTESFKREAGCLCGRVNPELILERKATTAFNSGAYGYIPLGLGDAEPFLFALSEVPLGKPEKDTLDMHANFVKALLASRLA
jgi:hypothetical protein